MAISQLSTQAEVCTCGHTVGAHGLRGQPGCSFCSCRRFQRPIISKPKIELSRYGSRALELLQLHPDFKACPKDALTEMVAEGRGRVYPSGSYLVRRGSVSHDVYVVLAGSVEVEADAEAADRTLHAGPGEVAGDLRALTGEERWASLVAEQPVEALEISAQKLKPIFTEYSDLFMALAQVLGRVSSALGDFAGTSELVDATLSLALQQYSASPAQAERRGLDPQKALEIQSRWRKLKEEEQEEDRARRAARLAIDAQMQRRGNR